MVELIDVNEDNWTSVLKLKITEDQKKYVASPVGILARAYAYRKARAKAKFIKNDQEIVGILMYKDMEETPKCYDLQQFLVDKDHQNKGIGHHALRLVLDELSEEGKYDLVEVCVNKEDLPALKLYKKIGFKDSGYIDPDMPDALNLVYNLEV